MAELAEVQARSRHLFESLLQANGASRTDGVWTREPTAATREVEAGAPPAPATPGFSVFDPEQAAAASGLALGLSVLAAASPSPVEGLDAALTGADRAAESEDPELVHHALSLFVTHSADGRRLVKPRTTAAAPRAFAPSRLTLDAVAPGLPPEAAEAGGSTGDERRLDFWREDPLANEHHEHWHEVYPYSGLFPSDWLQWAQHADRDALVEILTGLDPSQDWAAFLRTATPQQVRSAFISHANDLIRHDPQRWLDYLDALSLNAYRTLFHLNDRQGELFFYMHEQMLARYDAERLSHGLPRVTPFEDFAAAIPEGYDPGPALKAFEGYRERLPGRALPQADIDRLGRWNAAILDAIADKAFRGTQDPVPITRTNIGENVEGTDRRFRPEVPADVYPGAHNFGHGFISRLSEANAAGDHVGVMFRPRTAIRDPIFWRWHKHVDDLNFKWQKTQEPYSFDADAPPVLLRHSLDGGATPWSSPDLILCRTTDLPGHDRPDFLTSGGRSLGEQAFGGDAWSRDFTDGEVTLPDGTTFRTTAELRTEMKRREIVIEPPPGHPGPAQRFEIDYLTHEPFCYFLRVENQGDHDVDVTVRVFAAPVEPAIEPDQERRAWIEMDKFIHPVPAKQRVVVFRPDELSSVIKKPADKDPAALPAHAGGGNGGGSYCECGWPYTLLLPTGTEAGMPFRLLVLLTDAAVDQVPQPGRCGSMSFCGAVDRYPDSRDMGYPFSRPFRKPVAETFLDLANAAGRSFSIKRR